METKFLTPKQAAERIGMKPESITKMIRSGRLKATKVGGSRWLITEDDLNRFVFGTVEGDE